jgi:DNA-binding MarR family transcriptional regulator
MQPDKGVSDGMDGVGSARAEEILSSFAEIMSKLLLEHYQHHLAQLDLTLPQAQVLRALRRGPVLTGRLAAELRITAPAITQLTDRLIRKGLIERQAAADDRRCVLVALSAKGKRLVDQFRRQRSSIFSGALQYLSEDDQAQVVEGLSRVIEALERYESETASGKKLKQADARPKKTVVQ